MNQENPLSNPEKNLIAMGAAMGAGCRKCADKLYALAVGMKISDRQTREACQWGLDAKTQAVGTMRAKVDDLLSACCGRSDGGQKAGGPAGTRQNADKLMPLVRIASFVAANSAPDAAAEIRNAKAEGITEEHIRICISIGKMVRKNAQAFSDEEVEENLGGDLVEEMCCPLTSGADKASGCSCG